MAQTLSRASVVGDAIVTAQTVTACSETVTITVKDLSRTFVRMAVVGSVNTVVVSLGAGTDPMIAAGIGAKTFTIQPDGVVFLGGSWDSERYKTTSGTIVFTTSTVDTVTFECGELAVY